MTASAREVFSWAAFTTSRRISFSRIFLLNTRSSSRIRFLRVLTSEDPTTSSSPVPLPSRPRPCSVSSETTGREKYHTAEPHRKWQSGVGRFLDDSQLLVDGIPSPTLNTRINLNTLCIRRHRRMPGLTPSSYLRQHCPVEIGAAPLHSMRRRRSAQLVRSPFAALPTGDTTCR